MAYIVIAYIAMAYIVMVLFDLVIVVEVVLEDRERIVGVHDLGVWFGRRLGVHVVAPPVCK